MLNSQCPEAAGIALRWIDDLLMSMTSLFLNLREWRRKLRNFNKQRDLLTDFII